MDQIPTPMATEPPVSQKRRRPLVVAARTRSDKDNAA